MHLFPCVTAPLCVTPTDDRESRGGSLSPGSDGSSGSDSGLGREEGEEGATLELASLAVTAGRSVLA